MNILLEGYHGTSFESAQLIQKNNYDISIGDVEWLGDGVYFFVEGISTETLSLAKKWAITQAWDNKLKRNKYNNFCVLKSEIFVEKQNFLDLTTEDGIEVFEYLLEKYSSKIESIGKKLEFLDGMLINLARREGIFPIDVVKGNFYIKFAKERIKQIKLRTSNCTICTVYNPTKNIISTKVVRIGGIENEIDERT
jgi:hypothetical protein